MTRDILYGYNAHNRLTSASTSGTTLALSYDGQGRLETASHNGNATTFLYDGDELIAEYSGSTLTRRYVHGAGSDDPLVEYDIAGGAKQWLLTDERGSVIAESGSSAQVLRSHAYGPYGEPSSTAGSRFRYTGQIYLPGTALYYYKARVYNPAIGRFLQTDPLGYQDGMNWYAYVGNDPLNKTDPDGTETRDQYRQNIQNANKVSGVVASIADKSSDGFKNTQKATDAIKDGIAKGEIKSAYLKDVNKIQVKYEDKEGPSDENGQVKGINRVSIGDNEKVNSEITVYKNGAESMRDAAETVGHEIGHADPQDVSGNRSHRDIEIKGKEMADQVCKKEAC